MYKNSSFELPLSFNFHVNSPTFFANMQNTSDRLIFFQIHNSAEVKCNANMRQIKH